MDQDKIAQIVAGIATVIAAALAYLRGGRAKPDTYPPGDSRSAADLEIVRLRDERQEERDRNLTLSIQAVRVDCEIIIRSLKDSMGPQFEEVREAIRDIEERLRAVERKLDVVEDRQRRQD